MKKKLTEEQKAEIRHLVEFLIEEEAFSVQIG